MPFRLLSARRVSSGGLCERSIPVLTGWRNLPEAARLTAWGSMLFLASARMPPLPLLS